jgi:LmbE family N-acetylglucosaminyl deacetylase
MPKHFDYLAALRALPTTTAEAFLQSRHLLVIAPHPDDESLGMGGTIAAAVEAGVPVTVAFLTCGEGSHRGSASYPPAALATQRRLEALEALRQLGLGAEHAVFLDLPDGGLQDVADDRRDAALAILAERCARHGATVICATAITDPHRDHRMAFQWARQLRRRVGAELFAYPVWSWTLPATQLPGLAPTGWRIDIGRQRARKHRAILAHRTQHGQVVTDAEESFQLTAPFLALFETDYETLVRDDA